MIKIINPTKMMITVRGCELWATSGCLVQGLSQGAKYVCVCICICISSPAFASKLLIIQVHLGGKWMGESYCHGECHWKNNSCQERTMLEAFYGEQRKLTCVSCVMVTHDHSIVKWSVPVKPLLWGLLTNGNANLIRPLRFDRTTKASKIRDSTKSNVAGCPLCLTGVKENVPLSLSRCEKVEIFVPIRD